LEKRGGEERKRGERKEKERDTVLKECEKGSERGG
jgi:hypothetical protein